MKKLIILFLLILPSVSFCQLKVNDLIQIYSMDFDQFEKFCIEKGYELYQVEEHPESNGIYYKRGKGKDTRYIGLFEKFKNQGIKVKYQTSNSSEVVSFKQQIKSLGFIFIKSESVDFGLGSITQRSIYQNKTYIIDIITIPPDKTESFPSYEIGISRLK